MKNTQVIIAGDFNSRVGELPNEVVKEEVWIRSRDKVENRRGRTLMREMNEAGLYLMNGVGNEADFTFEHVNKEGKSTIDLMWLSQRRTR